MYKKAYDSTPKNSNGSTEREKLQLRFCRGCLDHDDNTLARVRAGNRYSKCFTVTKFESRKEDIGHCTGQYWQKTNENHSLLSRK